MNRVLFDAQQDYFTYATQLGNGGTPMVPMFGNLSQLVVSLRIESLSGLPHNLYQKFTSNYQHGRGLQGRSAPTSSSTPAASSLRDSSGSTSVLNANVDSALKNQFTSSDHTTISAMIDSHDVQVPKHNGSPVCLTWALRGRCTTGCRRKTNHVTYSKGTNQKLHALMDACEVPNPQE